MFKNLEYFYFHNCIYEGVWKSNLRRRTETQSMWDVLHKYPSDYKVVIVGDAAHTAHFSIGSGTKLAMEDAIAASSIAHADAARTTIDVTKTARIRLWDRLMVRHQFEREFGKQAI